MKLYDGRAKLRMARRMDIPACSQIIPCGKYLIFFTPYTKIAITDLTNIGMKLVESSAHVISDIVHCIYNERANLFFVTDSNGVLYYLMHSISRIKVNKLYDCKEGGNNARISDLGSDVDANIYMWFKEQKKLLKLYFDLQ